MPIEIQIFSPDPTEPPTFKYKQAGEVCLFVDPNSNIVGSFSVICEEADKGFGIGRVIGYTTDDDGNMIANVKIEKMFDTSGIVIEPLPSGKVLYISHKPKIPRLITFENRLS